MEIAELILSLQNVHFKNSDVMVKTADGAFVGIDHIRIGSEGILIVLDGPVEEVPF